MNRTLPGRAARAGKVIVSTAAPPRPPWKRDGVYIAVGAATHGVPVRLVALSGSLVVTMTSMSLKRSHQSWHRRVRARIALMYSTAGMNWPVRKVPGHVLY